MTGPGEKPVYDGFYPRPAVFPPLPFGPSFSSSAISAALPCQCIESIVNFMPCIKLTVFVL